MDRKPNETFEQYKARRKAEAVAERAYNRGRVVSVSLCNRQMAREMKLDAESETLIYACCVRFRISENTLRGGFYLTPPSQWETVKENMRTMLREGN